MSANLVSDRPASVSLLRILAVVILGYIIIGNVVALLVVSLLYGDNFMQAMANPLAHPDIRNIMVLAQGLASLVGLVLIPGFYLKTFEHRSARKLFTHLPTGQWVLILTATVIAMAVALSPVAEWNASVQLPPWGDFLREFEDQAAVLVKAFVADLTPVAFMFVFVVIAIIPAWGEELVFRGLIQTEMQRAFRNPHAGIWLAAAFFSAFHMQFFGFFPRFFMGAVMGYVYYWSGNNLWMPVTLHFLNNGLQITAIYLMQLKVHSFDVESTESAPLPAVAVSLLLMAGLLYYCKKNLAPAHREAPSELQ